MTADDQRHADVIVVGAGIVGLSTALWLQRAGRRVLLVDREGPAAGTSYGNAGVLAAASIVPVTVPGLWKKAPRMAFDPNQPLFLKWSYFPRLIPFLLKYLANGRDDRVQKIASGLSTLLHDCADQHMSIAKGTPAEEFLEYDSYLFGYRDRAAYEADAYSWNIRRNLGHPFKEMDAADLAAYDPSLEGRFGFGVECPEHGRITDPGVYVKALADHFIELGGELLIANLEGPLLSEDKCEGLKTSKGILRADNYVISTGVWSGDLADALGVSVPLESERGYHIEFVNPSITLRSPVMVASGKFVAHSMKGRLRCAGVVEFGGLDKPASKAPFELLKRQMKEAFPDLEYDRIDEWMGHRPSTADSLPVVGQAPLAANVHLGYGHQHIGLSGGPKTGRWLAQMITGENPNTDLSPFAPDRKL